MTAKSESGLETEIKDFEGSGGLLQGKKSESLADLLENIVDSAGVRRVVQFEVVAAATAQTTGDGKYFFRVPADLNGMNLVAISGIVGTAGTTGTTTVQIHNVTDTADMLSTELTIDSAEQSSDTAATAAVIDAAEDDVATGDILRVDIDAIHTGTAANGLYITLEFETP